MWVVTADDSSGAHRTLSATVIYNDPFYNEFGPVWIFSWLSREADTVAKAIAKVCIKLFNVFSDSLIAETSAKNRNNGLFHSSMMPLPLPSH
jgi:hypothetical protein